MTIQEFIEAIETKTHLTWVAHTSKFMYATRPRTVKCWRNADMKCNVCATRATRK